MPDSIVGLSGVPMPVFTIKAKDNLAVGTILYYKQACEAAGLHEQAAEVLLAYREVVEWRKQHPELCQMPDHPHVPFIPGAFSGSEEPEWERDTAHAADSRSTQEGVDLMTDHLGRTEASDCDWHADFDARCEMREIMDDQPSNLPIRRRTESEVNAYVDGYRAAIDTVLRTAGLELCPATAEKIKAFGEIVGTAS